MRIAYVLIWNVDGNSGIEKKVSAQTTTWRKLGHEVTIFTVSRTSIEPDSKPIDGSVIIPKIRSLNPLGTMINNGKAYRELKQKLDDYNPDFIYLRNAYYHKSLERALYGYPSCIEINGLPIQESMNGMFYNPSKILAATYLGFTIKKMLGMGVGKVCVSNEIRDTLFSDVTSSKIAIIPNSSPINTEKRRSANSGANDIPKLVFSCGSTHYNSNPKLHYHGLDKVVRLAELTVGKLDITVLGEGKGKFEASKLPPNIRFPGFLHKDDYFDVLRESAVGLGVAALHRKRMYEASPLRVRDYASVGLPMILPYKDTALVGCKSAEWLLELPNEEGNLEDHSEEIVEFARKMQKYEVKVGQLDPYFGANYWESKRLDFMKSLVELK